jgi:GAF domain-containing protein
MRERQPLPRLSFDLVGALVATAAAVIAYVVAVSLGELPPRPASVLLFAAAPLCALVAAPVLLIRARRDGDQPLGWFGAGLAVCAFTLLLQLAGYPTVSATGGPLRTDGQSSALLYLLFHLALYGGAIAGAAGLTGGARRYALGAGAVLAVLVGVNAVPSPELLGPDATFTPLLTGVEYAVAGLGALTTWLWVRASGRPASTLRGWVGVSLSVSTYEVLLNAISARRFDAVWWSSLSLRALGFAVLAAGCIGYLLLQLSRLERYTDTELLLREAELLASLTFSERLLDNARALGTSAAPAHVAAAVQESLRAVGGRVSLAYLDPEGAVVTVPEPGADVRALTLAALQARSPLFLDRPQDVAGRFGAGAIGALAVLPLSDAGSTAALLVSRPAEYRWTTADRELLTGLADQAAPALARAVQAEREHARAQTLQRALLPSGLPSTPRIALAARYLPAVRGDRVGGDWYDAWRLPDGRVCLVVGDVVGHGLEAAATMGRLRASIRALCEVDPSPGAVLSRLDAVETAERSGMIATVLCVVVDPEARTVLVARAGHMPLLWAAPGAAPNYLTDGGGPPIGCAHRVEERLVQLPTGSTAVLFTDGLVEDRSLPIDHGLDRLAGGLRRALEESADADSVAEALIRLRPGTTTDDVALLVVRFDPER